LHKLQPPQNADRSITGYTPSLSEFFINIKNNDPNGCTRALLKYGTEYDYKKSKFATEKNIDIFDRHVFGAMLTAVKFFSKDGKFLSELISEDSRIIRNAFEGALCTSKWKYEIDVRYFSFSRSNELRFIMGDIVKYAENKIRAFIGVKSRLSVYSVGTNLQNALNAYFEAAFAAERPAVNKKPEEKHEYDALYETPVKPFSLSEAKRIENESWTTTNDLIGAFDTEAYIDEPSIEEPTTVAKTKEIISLAHEVDKCEGTDLARALGKYLAFANAVKENDTTKIKEISKSLDMLPEAICDIVNEISVEIIGDILIEDSGNGFEIIECYADSI
jgi:hypothetical protein